MIQSLMFIVMHQYLLNNTPDYIYSQFFQYLMK